MERSTGVPPLVLPPAPDGNVLSSAADPQQAAEAVSAGGAAFGSPLASLPAPMGTAQCPAAHTVTVAEQERGLPPDDSSPGAILESAPPQEPELDGSSARSFCADGEDVGSEGAAAQAATPAADAERTQQQHSPGLPPLAAAKPSPSF